MNFKAIFVSSLVLSSLSAFAGTSDTLLLKGNVAAVNNIKVNALNSATSLDILAGTANTKIATVDETSNDRLGFDIMMSSINAGFLVHSADPTKKTSYQIDYNNSGLKTPTAAPVSVKNISSLNGLTTLSSDVKIKVTALPNAVAGDYSDTVTFSIVAH